MRKATQNKGWFLEQTFQYNPKQFQDVKVDKADNNNRNKK